jgi:hypothetical protein
MSVAAPDPAVIVSVALASPLESKVTEFELSEQLGEPTCAGCTEQASDTGLSNEFSKLKLSLEVALWPRLRLLTVGQAICTQQPIKSSQHRDKGSEKHG